MTTLSNGANIGSGYTEVRRQTVEGKDTVYVKDANGKQFAVAVEETNSFTGSSKRTTITEFDQYNNRKPWQKTFETSSSFFGLVKGHTEGTINESGKYIEK